MTREDIEKKMHESAEEIKPLVTTLVEALCEAHQKGYLAGVELGAKMAYPHWIPVEERLPEDNTQVLAYNGKFNEVHLVDYRSGIFEDYYGAFNKGIITHWMPLPEAPRRED